MRKLTVDEIIQGLVDAYERLLKLELKLESDYYQNDRVEEYHEVKGEVKALRWVLGQDEYNIITEENENE
tara:strand:+ start:251 stop:460 length:210 start_codon:yes stop_codon:yes gene_type:complete